MMDTKEKRTRAVFSSIDMTIDEGGDIRSPGLMLAASGVTNNQVKELRVREFDQQSESIESRKEKVNLMMANNEESDSDAQSELFIDSEVFNPPEEEEEVKGDKNLD